MQRKETASEEVQEISGGFRLLGDRALLTESQLFSFGTRVGGLMGCSLLLHPIMMKENTYSVIHT